MQRSFSHLDDRQKEIAVKVAEVFNVYKGEMLIAEAIDTQYQDLCFDTVSGDWIFREALDRKSLKLKALIYSKWVVVGASLGGALGGISAHLVIKQLRWTPDLVAKKVEDTVIAGMAAVGAVAGVALGCNHASKIYHYRIPHEKFEATNQRPKVDDRIKKILKVLLNTVAQGADNIICPISGEILQIPVSAPLLKRTERNEWHDCKTFEYKFIRDDIERERKCPVCEEPISVDDLVINNEKRKEVSKVIGIAIQWLVSKRQRSIDLDDITEKSFLENTQKIVGQIRSKSLSGVELYFVSKLLRRSIELYNNKMKYLTQVIANDLLQRIDVIGDPQYFNYHRQLINFSKAFKIDVAPLEEDPVQEGEEPIEEAPQQGEPVFEYIPESSDEKEEV